MKTWKIITAVTMMLFACTGYALASGSGPGVSADDVQKALTEGNARYAAAKLTYPHLTQARRTETAQGGQHPVATVLACSDSRVPVEFIFDQGIGDMFVVKVAGNVADTDEIGTIEYGVGHLKTPLLVVLGHTKCGAVTAVATGAEVHGSIPKLVDNIIPAVKKAKETFPDAKGDALINKSIEMNVWQAIEDAFKNSEEVRHLVKAGSLKVLGALYDIETGKVSWMGNHPKQSELLAGH